MRTTLNLPDALVDAAKRRAKAEGGTLTSFIEDAMRYHLEQRPAVRPRPMPTFGGPEDRGLLIDILDRDALDAAFEAEDLPSS